MPKRNFTAEQKHRLVEAHARSGQTLATFCAEDDIGRSTLGRWKRLLRDCGPSTPATHQTHTDALFTPLVTSAGDPEDGAGAEPANGWDVELDLGNGICLRLRHTP